MTTIASLEVPRVHNPGPEEFRDIVRAHRPVVISGLTDDWRALKEWNLAYIKERAGHRTVPIEFYPGGSWYGPWTTVNMSLRRYVEVLDSPGEPEMCYLAQAKVDDYLPELVDDVPVPAVLADVEPGAGVFLGRDSITALHYHSRDEALLCQISGRKTVVLYGPEDFGHLGYHRLTSYRFNFSRIDFSADDRFARHPRLARAVPYECTVEAGDALFIPLFWHHVTTNRGLSASVTFFWGATDEMWSPLPLALRSRTGFWLRNTVTERVMHGVEKVLGYT